MSKRRKDLGMVVSELSKALTPEQLAEMLALAYMTTGAATGSPHDGSLRKDPVVAPLFKVKLIQNVLPTERGYTRGFGYWSLTQRGWLVLLSRCEDDLRRLGALPPEPACEDEG